MGGWHVLQNSVGEWSVLPAGQELLNTLISPAELAALDAARVSPFGAASLARAGRQLGALVDAGGCLRTRGIHVPCLNR